MPKALIMASLHFMRTGQYMFEDGHASKFLNANDVAAAFSDSIASDSRWITPGVVRIGLNGQGEWYIYTAPPQIVEIEIVGEEKKIKIPIPRTVMVSRGHGVHIYAMKSGEFIPDGDLYNAPFPNVGSNGSICWGANRPGKKHEDAPKTWNLFFSSPFNDHLVQGKSHKYKDNISEQLVALAGKKNYPLKDLVEANTSMRRIVP